MESYLISDNIDTLQGMRMGGVSGEIINDSLEVIKRIDELIDDPNIGIIILTHKIKSQIEDEVMERKINSKETLIVEIPGPNQSVESNFITKYIRESIGLKL